MDCDEAKNEGLTPEAARGLPVVRLLAYPELAGYIRHDRTLGQIHLRLAQLLHDLLRRMLLSFHENPFARQWAVRLSYQMVQFFGSTPLPDGAVVAKEVD